jgi:predicted HicB family RNase H-like nuclease
MPNPNPCKEELTNLLLRVTPTLSKQQAEEVLALMNMREEDIDLSDIPEQDFSTAVRGLFYRGPMIRLTEDLRRYFCEIARRKGVPLNDVVNETLAKAVAVAETTK